MFKFHSFLYVKNVKRLSPYFWAGRFLRYPPKRFWFYYPAKYQRTLFFPLWITGKAILFGNIWKLPEHGGMKTMQKICALWEYSVQTEIGKKLNGR